MSRWIRDFREGMLSYTDEATYREAGQGGFQIRTFPTVAFAARGRGEVLHFKPIRILAVSCTAAVMPVQ